MAISTLVNDASPVKSGALRARCGTCGARWAWPAGAEPPIFEPLVRPQASCPRCSLVGPLTPEPHDERWWAYLIGEPPTRPAQPPQRPTLARTAHRSQRRGVRGGVKV